MRKACIAAVSLPLSCLRHCLRSCIQLFSETITKWGLGGCTPHANTHGQAEPVFGLVALLGIKLLPRMRTWQDVTFYRVDRETTYQYIDALLAQVVDWDLIERHWQEMMQVVLSIQASRVLPSMLLQKLGVYSQRNALYKAFCELGRVERTIFLLESMSIQPCGSISARRPRKSNLTISLPSGWRLVDWSCAVGTPWSSDLPPIIWANRNVRVQRITTYV